MIDLSKEEIRTAVRDRYGLIAREQSVGCCDGGSACCGSPAASNLGEASRALGYGIQELESVPGGANLGLGCGNPQAIAALKPGETVLDLGSGGGFDCFLAARAVGEHGRVIGVDMTHDMLKLARTNSVKGGYSNVEFRLGEIENLPVADASVDVIISNCVLNLSPDKPAVAAEAFRVLKAGGRLAVSDTVAFAPIPDELKKDLAQYSACVTGSATVAEWESMLAKAGFVGIRIRPKAESREFIKDWVPGMKVEDFVVSATIEAVRP
jgi:SAM-dependent methyltransferase